MKVVVSGSTGYIGGQVLTECLKHPSITSVLVLTRRDIPDPQIIENPKAKVIIVKDFTAYDESTAAELKAADAAIWCLGTYNGNEQVDIAFPIAFIRLIKSHRSSESTPFRYVQLGGAFTEPPPKEGEEERSLWYYTNGRRVRGKAEAVVLEEHDPENARFEVHLVKPGGVLTAGAGMARCIFGQSLWVGMDELRTTIVDLAVNRNEQKVFKNHEIITHGKKLLDKTR